MLSAIEIYNKPNFAYREESFHFIEPQMIKKYKN
jgi:hypothetical protein